jgi:hypothetical protein
MVFDMGGAQPYRVVVCPGRLYEDGAEIWATLFRDELLISGDVPPGQRLESVFDQLWRLWERHHGELGRLEGGPTFVITVMRQLLAQGGEDAVASLRPYRSSKERRAAA